MLGAGEDSSLDADATLVIAFLGTECPLARLYAPRLNALAEEFAGAGVRLFGVFSNTQDSPEDVADFSREFQLTFPTMKDDGNRHADLLGAQRTPEVFLVDKDKRVRFCGRIDDQYEIELPRNAADHEFLRQALEEVLGGEEVARPSVPAVGCIIGREHSAEGDERVTYANTVAAIMNERCVKCHRPGEVAPFALTDFAEVRGWADMIVEVTTQRRMPPVPEFDDPQNRFHEPRGVSREEIASIEQWIEEGTPYGDPAELPTPPTFTKGWHMSREPDVVIYASEEPFEVPAEGVIDYQYFTVDPGFTEDKWVLEAEIVPGNRRVVHHAAVLCRTSHLPGRFKFSEPMDRLLGGYLPGMGYGDGKGLKELDELKIASFVPAGSKVEFQIHYTAVGSPQFDRTKLGLIFCDADEVEHVRLGRGVSNWGLEIPPETPDYKVEKTSRPLPSDSRLTSLGVHMHLRGKSFRFDLLYPDGRQELLLDIPRYDFNWQFIYLLKEPMILPAGTQLHCTAHFDNSSNNPANPDPTATVRWGDFTEDEMMVGTYHLLLTRDEYLEYIDPESKTQRRARPRVVESAAASAARSASRPTAPRTVQPASSRGSQIATLIASAALVLAIVLLGYRCVQWARTNGRD